MHTCPSQMLPHTLKGNSAWGACIPYLSWVDVRCLDQYESVDWNLFPALPLKSPGCTCECKKTRYAGLQALRNCSYNFPWAKFAQCWANNALDKMSIVIKQCLCNETEFNYYTQIHCDSYILLKYIQEQIHSTEMHAWKYPQVHV